MIQWLKDLLSTSQPHSLTAAERQSQHAARCKAKRWPSNSRWSST